LNQIFSGASREDAVDKIHVFLEKVGEEVRKGLIPPDKFVIHKGLTKKPEEYADKDSQPHVQVALRMQTQGITARVGDTIPYVICVGKSSTIGKRAYHIDDVLKEDSTLEIDLEWYLANQVHPPIARLCAPIEGTDNARLALCLGLDSHKYHLISSNKFEEEELQTLESQLSDAERFKDVTKWSPTCCYCQTSHQFLGIARVVV
jgi:DNA polymerase alpha subunit A